MVLIEGSPSTRNNNNKKIQICRYIRCKSLNETWNTFSPDFTSCFQDIVLVLVPCIVFSVTGLLNLYNLSRYNSSFPLPWTWRLILKLLLGLILFIISVSWCSMSVYKKLTAGSDSVPSSTITASVARCFTYVIVIVLMVKQRYQGITTSTVLSLFWICFTICGIVLHRSIIIKQKSQTSPPDWNFILGLLYYPIIYLQLIFSCFADVKSFTPLERGSPLEEEPFLSGISYVWFNKTVYKGFKRLLTVKDFLPLAVKLKAPYLYDVFSKHWNFNSSAPDFQKQSLAWALFKSFWPWLCAGLALDLLYVLCLLMPPLILQEILQFVKDDYYYWRIYFYCATVFIVSFIGRVLQNNFVMYLLNSTNQIKSALITAIYRKNLSVASASRKNFSSGSITNLISVDVTRISNFTLYATSLITSPFRIILVIFYMWEYLGPSCLAGVAVMVLLIPVTFYLSRISEKFTDQQMIVKDFRLKCINEILSGIKILKFYAWEVPFSLKLLNTRKDEIKLIRLSQICFVAISFVFACAPILVAIASFTTYLLIDSRHVLDPTRAFVSLNLLDQLRFALFSIPDSLSELIQTITSIDRIRTFLISEETDPAIVGSDTVEGEAVTIDAGNFFWSKDGNFVLDDINLHVPYQKLVAVIGPVGSGKTSLLSAILGDMYKSSGSINVKGSLAYVPQEAWVLNRTMKNNILLEKPMVEDKYKKILDCCCLRPDLEMLPGRDETEIGEKGINLSGGQKQRVSLARALFQNRDIYLLDDPLSAVDAHVRKALFEDVIGKGGLLKNKTRILVTHDVSVLPHMDLIVRMEEGKILEIGTYRQLMDGSETFLHFIKTHAGSNSQDSGDNSANNKITEETIKEHGPYSRAISEDFTKPSISKQSSMIEGTNLIEDERMEEGSVKSGLYFNYAKHVGGFMLTLALMGYLAFASIEASSNVWLSKWSADPMVNGTQDSSLTRYRLSVYGGLGAAQAITNVLGTASLVYGSTKASQLYHNQMLESVLKSPMSFFDVTPMGRIVNRFSTDMDTLDIHIIYEIDGWLNCSLYSLATFIVIGMNTPLFLACILPLAVIYYIFLRLHLNTSRQIRRLESTTRSPLYSHLLESIYGVLSIKAFRVEKEFTEKMEEIVDNHIACSFNTAACNRWLHFWLDMISCVIILIATWLALDNRHELGASVVGLVVTYALTVTDALMWFIRTNNELENKSVAIERVDEYCNLQSEAPRRIPDSDPDDSWPQKGEIVFDNYCTRYRENLDLVLKDVTLNVLPNEKVGIVGRTGAGKSSVTLALFRIVEPAHGTIIIDNVDLAKIGLYALRSKLTIIPQDPVLFTGTLRFNLDPNDEYSDEDIWTSLSNAHLKDFVTNLSEGLQHSIDEGGGNLSSGQKQLLCLSRALLKKSKILILDEATAAVDMDTDKLVQDTIKTAFANHTVITIAHRLNTVMDYDKIVVMDSGEVVEVGSPASLLENEQSQFHQLSKEAGLI